MKIYETSWEEGETLSVSLSRPDEFLQSQPCFGVEIGWNTKNLLKPYFVFHFWHKHIQFGWLAG
ncbi:MAG TPA: hypothetical protein PLA27_17045 [Anaerolineales bacterium]|nr:hypothetical protein [Anaerolineales bacterium]